jgi:hypothetical protein
MDMRIRAAASMLLIATGCAHQNSASGARAEAGGDACSSQVTDSDQASCRAFFRQVLPGVEQASRRRASSVSSSRLEREDLQSDPQHDRPPRARRGGQPARRRGDSVVWTLVLRRRGVERRQTEYALPETAAVTAEERPNHHLSVRGRVRYSQPAVLRRWGSVWNGASWLARGLLPWSSWGAGAAMTAHSGRASAARRAARELPRTQLTEEEPGSATYPLGRTAG